LRANVDPKGRATNVEFYLNGVRKGIVSAGNGIVASIVELQVDGLDAATSYTVTSEASSIAGSASGGAVQFSTVANPIAPVIQTLTPAAITTVSAVLR